MAHDTEAEAALQDGADRMQEVVVDPLLAAARGRQEVMDRVLEEVREMNRQVGNTLGGIVGRLDNIEQRVSDTELFVAQNSPRQGMGRNLFAEALDRMVGTPVRARIVDGRVVSLEPLDGVVHGDCGHEPERRQTWPAGGVDLPGFRYCGDKTTADHERAVDQVEAEGDALLDRMQTPRARSAIRNVFSAGLGSDAQAEETRGHRTRFAYAEEGDDTPENAVAEGGDVEMDRLYRENEMARLRAETRAYNAGWVPGYNSPAQDAPDAPYDPGTEKRATREETGPAEGYELKADFPRPQTLREEYLERYDVVGSLRRRAMHMDEQSRVVEMLALYFDLHPMPAYLADRMERMLYQGLDRY